MGSSNYSISQTPITDANIKSAVDLWVSDPTTAEATYGDISDWSTSNVTNMYRLFNEKVNFNDDISNWDVSKVTNMGEMFFHAYAFNQDIGAWDVSKVTNMYGMLHGTPFNHPLGSWDVSSVTNMSRMFEETNNFDQPIGSWDVSSVTDMRNMFLISIFNQSLDNWDVSNVVSTDGMFSRSPFNRPLDNWDVSNVVSMDKMFDSSGLSTESYDAILIGWSSLDLKPNVNLGAAGVSYCNGQTARQTLVNVHGWSFSDAGLDCTSLSIEDNDSNGLSFSIYPNPTADFINIKAKTAISSVKIYSTLGRLVKDVTAENRIDISDISAGYYIVKIKDELGHLGVKKLIKN